MADPLLEPVKALKERDKVTLDAREEAIQGILEGCIAMLEEFPRHAPPQLEKVRANLKELEDLV